ncbi:response regulator transcription factor [Clostridium oryzae]|uniref:Stage 0 sporulation protein A homolog n=1 Tax=Clostridium oryzae TaxID=1450648 RepID=A0A1V4IEQ2_9CLOT|nr:response regulator transcription factor [Clostridium oryzae]OPJ58488.1 transcriptional regulatory protein WalR [Clostridium oryzae]
MDKVLIIEDNKDVNMLLAETLIDEGYEVVSAFDGLAGSKTIRTKKFDLILLDIMLPYKSGDEILRELREYSDIPVIILSAKDMVGTKIDLLKLGADDYVTKPFDLGEVAARVASNLRRFHKLEKVNSVYNYKDVVLDISTKRISVNGEELDLTAKEYQIMALLLQNRGKVFSKANIYETIWNEEYLGDDNAVKTHMSNLRNKLKKANPSGEYIETVWGLGYRLYKD